jgi:hypothetical protein
MPVRYQTLQLAGFSQTTGIDWSKLDRSGTLVVFKKWHLCNISITYVVTEKKMSLFEDDQSTTSVKFGSIDSSGLWKTSKLQCLIPDWHLYFVICNSMKSSIFLTRRTNDLLIGTLWHVKSKCIKIITGDIRTFIKFHSKFLKKAHSSVVNISLQYNKKKDNLEYTLEWL